MFLQLDSAFGNSRDTWTYADEEKVMWLIMAIRKSLTAQKYATTY
jgi:hypothetical protein